MDAQHHQQQQQQRVTEGINAKRVESVALDVPPLNEISDVLSDGLLLNFADVTVNVVECPDLTQGRWSLSSPGLSGRPCLVDLGGCPYLLPTPQLNWCWDLRDIACIVDRPTCIGAGAASKKHIGYNAELMPNMNFETQLNCSRCASVNVTDKSVHLEQYSHWDINLLGNLLFTDGKAGPVLEVKVSKRTGNENFVTCMRKALAAHYGDKHCIGMGGVFQVLHGTVKAHVMPDFSEKPLENDDDVNEWLNFYDMEAPLTCLSTFVSCDPGLDLRVEHTHFFSDHGVGGHYHHDTTRDDVMYHGFLTPAEQIFRIDRPLVTHSFGRD